MPEWILDKLNADTVAALSEPDLQRRLVEQGIDATPMSRAQYTDFLAAETVRWAKGLCHGNSTEVRRFSKRRRLGGHRRCAPLLHRLGSEEAQRLLNASRGTSAQLGRAGDQGRVLVVQGIRIVSW